VLPLPEGELTLLFDFESVEESRRFVLGLQRAGEPVSAASHHRGQLRLRFSGQGATLARLAKDLDGEECGNDYWRDLRCLQLPFFTDTGPEDLLYDWNGRLCWSQLPGQGLQRRVGDEPAVPLSEGPANPGGGTGPLAELQRRVALAFDPAGVFQ
jgi:hypothetical protein